MRNTVRTAESLAPIQPRVFMLDEPVLLGGHAVAYWLRHYATNWKVAGSIPDEVHF
jgi:hypothetical protein